MQSNKTGKHWFKLSTLCRLPVILSKSKSGLQNCLKKLQTYKKRWRLTINKMKSRILIFETIAQRRTYFTSNWVFENKTLDQVEEYPYLRLNIHCSGNFKLAQRVLYNKALRDYVYHSVFRSFLKIENIPIKTLSKLFSAMISPILLYCCEIWSPYLFGKIDRYEKFKNTIFAIKSDIEKLHIKFCKRILGVHSKSTNLAVYAELGRTPLIIQAYTMMSKFWLRINNAP